MTISEQKRSLSLSEIPVSSLQGVGPKLALCLEKLAIHSILDLLFHLPFRYEDRTQITKLNHLQLDTQAAIYGKIQSVALTFGKRPTLLVKIADDFGQITARFFHFNAAQKKRLQEHLHGSIRCFGLVRWVGNHLELVHPEYQLLQPGQEYTLAQKLTPIYRTGEGVTQRTLQRLVQTALQFLTKGFEINDPLIPFLNQMRNANRLAAYDLSMALQFIHAPSRETSLVQLLAGTHPAQQRLALEELLAHHLSLRKFKATLAKWRAAEITCTDMDFANIRQLFHFQLTAAQLRVCQEIRKDLQLAQPMLRLVQGDVGSGKTALAAMATAATLANGWQVAIMAPTELLAQQLFHVFKHWFRNGIPNYQSTLHIAELSSKLTPKQLRTTQHDIAEGNIHLVIGTHALFQKHVHFARLGLIVIDEQHRFGVAQRLALVEKGKQDDLIPHQLIMTATPIPRTLAMTLFADIQLSIVDELPPDRKPIQTVVINKQRRAEIIARIKQAAHTGQQVYWVCTAISENENISYQPAENVWQELQAELTGLKIALVHGKMKSEEKHAAMQAFKDGIAQVLVATTVIEVGVDVPNATVMIIEDADRLGLAQLHQLRGRVGRGSTQSYCVLLYNEPLSPDAHARLCALRESQDGFFLAEKDLELRGPGEVFGTKQTGTLEFHVADLVRDQKLCTLIPKLADQIMATQPEIADTLIERWIGSQIIYSAV